MNFLRSRSEQMADNLRGCILRGELVQPLPNTREWSARLGVSRPTLRRALRQLQREGLLSISRHGIQLSRIDRGQARGTRRSARLVRVLYPGRDFPGLHHCIECLSALSERLHTYQVECLVERCTEARFNAILHERIRNDEVFILIGVSQAYQKRFLHSRKATLVCGEPATGVPLPYVTDDQDAAVRHATHAFLRQGFPAVSLFIGRVKSPGIQKTISTFQRACAEWLHQPVHAEVLMVPLEPNGLGTAVRRFAARFRGRRGLVVVSPIPISLIATALMERGIVLPKQAAIAAILHPENDVQIRPPPLHYASSIPKLVKDLADAVVHYFETGDLPPVRKRNSVEVRPSNK